MSEAYRKGIYAEFEAREILKKQGFYVTRCLGQPHPPDLFAARKGEFLMLMIRHSKFPVRDAHVVSIVYAEDLDRFRRFGFTDMMRFECWIHAPPDGWRFYELLPGGIRRIRHAWDTPLAPEGEGEIDEAGILGEPLGDETVLTLITIRDACGIAGDRATKGVEVTESIVIDSGEGPCGAGEPGVIGKAGIVNDSVEKENVPVNSDTSDEVNILTEQVQTAVSGERTPPGKHPGDPVKRGSSPVTTGTSLSGVKDHA